MPPNRKQFVLPVWHPVDGIGPSQDDDECNTTKNTRLQQLEPEDDYKQQQRQYKP